MFAGKSEELMRRVRRARIAGRTVEVVSHTLDTRRGAGRVSSHSGLDIPSRAVTDAARIEDVVGADVELVAIDEAQFFGPGLLDVVGRLADRGCVVVVAGLDVTFDARPFAPVSELGALAERVDRLTAVCGVCGADAAFHVRLEAPAADALRTAAEHVGGAESYQARCRVHLADAPWRRGTGTPTG
ncbi:thymidine kinase [Oerskovia flava]|uniref:thymidine kinase n=1 Tax=Oerskovia flava TaxID=2986422 RepID=UPI002240A1B1|nr:thymidine kinase [Oerskovia sp. JB1-3-2]